MALDSPSSHGHAVLRARQAERDARCKAERLEREAALAAQEWKRASAVRMRAELWFRAEKLRKELAEVEAAAASITIDNPNGKATS